MAPSAADFQNASFARNGLKQRGFEDTMAAFHTRWRERLRPWLIAATWLLCAGLFKAALAQPIPPQPLTLVTPFGTGSGPDHVARTMALVWTERTGEPVEVRNLPDRQGYVAARLVASAPPDGQVLLLTTSPLLQRPPRLPDEPFTPPAASVSDFTPLARVGLHPFVIVFPPGMFGDRLTPLSPPLPAPAVAGALSRFPTGTARGAAMVPQSLTTLDATPDHEDFSDLVTRDVIDWNALLAPPRLPAPLAARLRAEWRQVIADARVRVALAQSGTELWEAIPEATR